MRGTLGAGSCRPIAPAVSSLRFRWHPGPRGERSAVLRSASLGEQAWIRVEACLDTRLPHRDLGESERQTGGQPGLRAEVGGE